MRRGIFGIQSYPIVFFHLWFLAAVCLVGGYVLQTVGHYLEGSRVGEVLLLTSIYLVMPVGRLAWSHALVGGIVATLLWEGTRRVLVWYFSTLSFVSVIYGSLATTIIILLSFEFAAIILLLGAQVIAEYERIDHGGVTPRG